jgi:hypothetical protein
MRPWSAVVAAGAAALWAYDLTILQPGTEPAKPWAAAVAENNTYWARDLRVMAIVAAITALVVAVDGARRRSVALVSAGVAWCGLDVLVDRLDVAGPAAGIGLGVGAVGVVLVAAAGLGRGRSAPYRPALTVAGCVAAALAPFAAAVESPTDAEPALNVVAGLVALLLVGVVLLAIIALVPAWSRARVVTVAGLGVAGVAAAVTMRVAGPGTDPRLWTAVLLGATLLTAVVILRRDEVRALPVIGVGALTVVGYATLALLGLYLMVLLVPAAAVVTSLAANPPVNSADTDAITGLAGLFVGLVWAGIVGWFERARP